ncbi:MAG: response regulator transcription factor [Lachnospiraceae bacterium]|nr:response regulator transcription factor [Lachnospiraceae bacterium]
METKEIRILLVEDDEELSLVTAMRLRNSGFTVTCAMDGQQALEKMMAERIDLILLDVMLPDTDGHELCCKIRGGDIGFGGPIIFMSCLGDSTNIVDAFREGGNDYIVKPAKLEVLLERINENLKTNENKKEPDSRLWFRQFMIDTKTRSVYRVSGNVCGEKIELSRTEYDILMVLVSRPEEIFLYRQLYKAVWGMEDVGDVRTLMVHVSNLRKKIDGNHSEMIRSIRGVGYLFQDE